MAYPHVTQGSTDDPGVTASSSGSARDYALAAGVTAKDTALTAGVWYARRRWGKWAIKGCLFIEALLAPLIANALAWFAVAM